MQSSLGCRDPKKRATCKSAVQGENGESIRRLSRALTVRFSIRYLVAVGGSHAQRSS